MLRTLGLALAFLAAPAAGTLAFAQGTMSDPRVAEAKTACAAGDVQRSIRLLAELYTATNDPIWIFNQGRCYHQNSLLPQAEARFKEFLRKSANSPPEDIRDAQRYIDEIEADLRKSERRTEGRTGEAGATLASAGTLSPSAEGRDGRSLRYAGVGCGLFGGAALVSGIVFSLLVDKANRDVSDQTRDNVVPASAVRSNLRNGPRYETLQWVSYSVGAASLLAGAVLYYFGLDDPAHSSKAQLSPLILGNGAGAILGASF